MLITTDYVQPAELTGYAREALADLETNQFTLSQHLPSIPVDDLQYRFNRGGAGLTEVATFRAYDAEASIGKRPGLSRVSGDLPPVSRKIRLGEYERLRQRRLDAAIADAVYNDTDLMVAAVGARIELARGSALSLGAVTIEEDGVIATVDFNRRASHSNQAPAVLWSSAANATPIADLIAWSNRYAIANGGRRPGAILTSQTVLSNILRSAEVRSLAASNGQSPSIVSPLVLNTILTAYNLPPIIVNDAQVSVDGAATRIIPENNLLLLPAADATSAPSSSSTATRGCARICARPCTSSACSQHRRRTA